MNPVEPIPVLSSSPYDGFGPRCRWLKLEDSYLEAHGLPVGHSYPLLDGLPPKDLRLSQLLYSLMAYLAYDPQSRPEYEAATLRLAELIPAHAPHQQHVDGLCSSPRLAPVALEGEVVTFQVEGNVLIALEKEVEGLAFQCYRPLCLDGCDLLRRWSPDHWGYSQTPRAQQGLTYRSFWPHGLKLKDAPIAPATVWAQLAVARLYRGFGDRQNSACQIFGSALRETHLEPNQS